MLATRSKINTGGVNALKDQDDRTVLKLTLGDSTREEAVVSCYGWTRGDHAIGLGWTPEAAIRDWCDNTGNDFDNVINECRFIVNDKGLLPPGLQSANW